MSDVIETLIADRDYSVKLISSYQKEIKSLPAGKLYNVTIRGCQRHYYAEVAGKEKYLSKKKEALTSALQRKAFLEKSSVILQKNIALLSTCIEGYVNCNPVDARKELEERQNQLTTFLNHSDCNEMESASRLFPEHLVHITPAGENVRSKSEAIIAGLLYANEIPYRYEKELRLNEKTYYPDFTIVRPHDGKVFYWEHFGMVDDPEYLKGMNKKIEEYRQNGISQWKNLLVSYDAEQSIDMQMIQKIIDAFLR
ncbi:MAG: hypothetical protein PHQ50_01380 [Eubacteriales bacterium]|nr:hypothetical protein [Eubacteriales bacterium]